MAEEQGFTGTRVGFDIIHSTKVHNLQDQGLRLPDFLQSWIPDTYQSPSRAKKECRKGHVLVNGTIKRVGDTVYNGDTIEIQVRSNPGLFPQGYAPFQMDVVFEDDCCAVVVKPPGVSTHGNADGVQTRQTVRACLPYTLKPSNAKNQHILRRPIHVHRLDRATGGLLVAAKTQEAVQILSEQFRTRGLKKKRYRAIVIGRVDEQQGTISEPLDGKEAITHFEVISHTRSLKFDWLTTVNLYPETGRTHQLRKHMANRGTPILGDEKYSPPNLLLSGHGLFLWAVELQFEHPTSKEMVICKIDEPGKYATRRRREQERWEKLGEQEDAATK